MQIHLSPRHLVLTAAIHSHVVDKIQHLETLMDHILAAHVVLLKDETATHPYIVKIHLAIPGPDLHAEAEASDLYLAINEAVDKLENQVRKEKTKRIDKRKHECQLDAEEEKRGYRHL